MSAKPLNSLKSSTFIILHSSFIIVHSFFIIFIILHHPSSSFIILHHSTFISRLLSFSACFGTPCSLVFSKLSYLSSLVEVYQREEICSDIVSPLNCNNHSVATRPASETNRAEVQNHCLELMTGKFSWTSMSSYLDNQEVNGRPLTCCQYPFL